VIFLIQEGIAKLVGRKCRLVHLAPTNILTLEDIRYFVGHLASPLDLNILITYALCLLATWIILVVIFKSITTLRQLREKYVFLEITPPQDTKIANISTTQLFTIISGLLEQRSWLDRLLLRQISCSFEIVSQKSSGVRYFVRVPQTLAGTIEKSLRAYVPGIQIKDTSDFLKAENINAKVIDFNLSKHFALPLNDQDDLKNHDPLAYLASNMTQLKSADLIALQIVLKPMNSLECLQKQNEINHIKTLICHNRFVDWVHNANDQRILLIFSKALETVAHIIIAPLLFVADFITGNQSKLSQNSATVITPTPADIEIEGLVKSKLNQPLFVGSVRAMLVSEQEIAAREKGMLSSFSSFRHHSGQSLIKKKQLFHKLAQGINLWRFRERLGGSLVLSASEVGSLYHFPFATDPYTEDLARVRSRELPAPLSLKKIDTKFDVTFGANNYGGENVPIGLTLEQRLKHMYVIGKTGMGKTTLLKNAIYQDMVNGKGLAVFDPHGDLLQELLAIIPENRRGDVIVFDPSDREWPIGLNILAPRVKFTDKEDEQEWITSSVLAVFAKITAKEYWGPRMEHILRNATLTALQTPNPNLYTLQQLLTDKGYQKKVAATLKDPVLKQFWNKEFALLGKMQLSSVTAPLTQRLGSFITTKMSRHILLQEKSTISISEIMDEGKILLVNLSKGDLGEDMSFFFGVILTSIIWMAAYQRTKVPESKRADFFLYVDEFQNFATPRFSEITSEGRKFHVSLIASHQNIAQVEDQSILKVVAGNANSIICLKASPDDEKFILPFMEPEVAKGDIVNLAPYHFFMKVANEKSENAFSGVTIPLTIEPSDEVKFETLKYSREHFAIPRKEVEEYLDKLFTGRLDERPKIKQKTTAKETKKASKKPDTLQPKLYQVADTGTGKI